VVVLGFGGGCALPRRCRGRARPISGLVQLGLNFLVPGQGLFELRDPITGGLQGGLVIVGLRGSGGFLQLGAAPVQRRWRCASVGVFEGRRSVHERFLFSS
jgi:hypothetical protein